MSKKLIYQGSVKNLYEQGENVLFEYSDRYSLFDWGEMPDHLEQKGIALALMGSLFFIELDKYEVLHHFIGLSDGDGNKVSFSPQRHLLVKKVPVTPPVLTAGGFDYSFYQTKPQTGLVPLEVIFRFGIGKGSSLLKRAKEDPSLLSQWNLTSVCEGDVFESPLIDFSTKLEPGDRYLSHQEAKNISGLTEAEFKKLKDVTTKVSFAIKDIMNRMGLEIWDGKLEWAFVPGDERSFMLVDSIGLDELRIEKNGHSISKEFLREYYRKTSWFDELNVVKARGSMKGNSLRDFCSSPPKLPLSIRSVAEALYLSFTNDLSYLVIGKKIFPETYTMKSWPEKFQ